MITASNIALNRSDLNEAKTCQSSAKQGKNKKVKTATIRWSKYTTERNKRINTVGMKEKEKRRK